MLTCPKCQAVNAPDAVSCSRCAAHLLIQPAFGERVKKNIAWIIIFLVGLAVSTYLNFSQVESTEFLQVCLSVVILVLFVILLVTLFRKHSLPELYRDRARKLMILDQDQARFDFLKGFELTPSAKRFNDLLKYFADWNKIDPSKAQLALINLIRISPEHDRRSLGGKYPKTMAKLDEQWEVEAYNDEANGDRAAAARKRIYRSYFMESKMGSMFQTKQTTDMMDAVIDGAQKGWQQASFISSLKEIRTKVMEGGEAVSILACSVCRQIVNADHDPKHKKKLYPIYLMPDEMNSVVQAFNERYSLPKK